MSAYQRASLCLYSLLIAVMGCSGDEGLEGTLAPNLPPNTEIRVGPPSREAGEFQLRLYWTGSDPDGEVDHFQWRISDNGRDGIVDREDTLGLQWHSTVRNDSTFLVSADLDSFPDDVEDPRQDRSTYRFWQTHTIFVRSVDDQGGIDATPAHSSFTSTTIAPRITINHPAVVPVTTCLSGSRTLTYGWTAFDPDDPLSDPAAIRYLLVDLDELPEDLSEEMDLGANECLSIRQYQDLDLIARLPESYWGPWIPFDAPDDSAKTVTFPRYDPDRRLLFAVQAMDQAGAITPTFDWNVNVRHVRTTVGKSPRLTVNDRYLGASIFFGVGQVRSPRIIPGQPLEFSWTADAQNYGGVLEAYRYGWDVIDSNDEEDPGWNVGWGLQWRSAPARVLHSGHHDFVILVRDNSGALTRAVYQFEVHPLPTREEQRPLLLIDDWGWSPNPSSLAEQQKWINHWVSLLDGRVNGFSSKIDILSVNLEPRRAVFETISQYQSVIWFSNGRGAESELRDSLFPSNGRPTFNWMSLYLQKLGNMLICGIQPMQASLPIQQQQYPILIDSSSEWLWRDWCLDAVDMVRPPNQRIPCEAAGAVRTRDCDRLMRAEVPEAFFEAYPSANGYLGDLLPNRTRTEYWPRYKLSFEELYNFNPSCLAVTLSPRQCQRTMFQFRARRDEIDPSTGEPWIEDAQLNCPPRGYEKSTLDGAPAGLVISTHSATKPIPGSEDFLWGFHPLAFSRFRVEGALIWIMRERWNLDLVD